MTLTDLCGVQGWAASPIKQVLVDVSVISSQDRIQLLVMEVKGIYQHHGVGPQLSQQLLDTNRNQQHLGHAQQSSLKKKKGGWGLWMKTCCWTSLSHPSSEETDSGGSGLLLPGSTDKIMLNVFYTARKTPATRHTDSTHKDPILLVSETKKQLRLDFHMETVKTKIQGVRK